MPYGPADAQKHNGKANTPRRQRMWSDVFNSELGRHGDEGRAFASANAVVNRDWADEKRKRMGKPK